MKHFSLSSLVVSFFLALVTSLFVFSSPALAQFPGDPCLPAQEGAQFNNGTSVVICTSGYWTAYIPNQNNPSTTSPGSGASLNFREKAPGVLPGIPDDYSPTDPSGAFGSFIGRILNIAFTVAVILVFFYLIWGAFEWITAGGDSGKLTSARNRITQSVIGLIVLASTVAILVLVQRMLNVCILEFGSSCTPPAASAPADPMLPPEAGGRCTGRADCQGLSENICKQVSYCSWSTNF